MTYSLTVTQTLNWMVRMSCEIESQIIAGFFHELLMS
jgi:hypothetical protein